MEKNVKKCVQFLIIILAIMIIILPFIIILGGKNRICENYVKSNSDILYIENFITNKELKKIEEHKKKINLKNDNLNPEKRKGIFITDGYIFELLNSKRIQNKIQKIIGKEYKMSDFPIEYRTYPTGSNGMRWHIDTPLFEEPQYEFVLTIFNNSDSKTEWINSNKIISKSTKPKSLIIVKALSKRHRVTKLTSGTRDIIKFVYSKTDKRLKNFTHDINCRYNDCKIN